jgi:hypothetical protein
MNILKIKKMPDMAIRSLEGCLINSIVAPFPQCRKVRFMPLKSPYLLGINLNPKKLTGNYRGITTGLLCV